MIFRCGLILLFFWSCPSFSEVVILANERAPVIDHLASELDALLAQPVLIQVDQGESSHNLINSDIVILVGDDVVRNWRGSTPAIAVWAKRNTVIESLKHLSGAILSEPPLRRQLSLIKKIFNDAQVSLIYSEKIAELFKDDLQYLKDKSVHLVLLDDYPNLNYALKDALSGCDVLLGIADTEIYNATTIKNVLISAYRKNVPLVGPSQSYIRAGAIATTYSSIADTAHRLADIINGDAEFNVSANPYYHVAFNAQVARSLNYSLPDPSVVLKSLYSQVVE